MAIVPRPDRLLAIDSLRGVAALWVVIFHFSTGVRFFWLTADPSLSIDIAPFTTNIQGLLAVDLFFMISGFVIIMTLGRTNSIADFALSRFSRLFPAYWVCFILTTATIVLVPAANQTITAPQVLAGATMFNAYLGFNPVETVYWSLAVELAFYTIMAGVFAAGLLNRIELLGGAWLIMSALLFTLFPNVGAMLPWRVQTASILPYTPLFLAGILLYRTRMHGWTVTRATLLAACFLVRLATFHSAEAIVGTVLIFAVFTAASLGWAGFLCWRPIVSLGAISYPLYLVHESIGYRIQWTMVMGLHASPLVGFLVALFAAITLAWAISVFIERPAQGWIRRSYRTATAKKLAGAIS